MLIASAALALQHAVTPPAPTSLPIFRYVFLRIPAALSFTVVVRSTLKIYKEIPTLATHNIVNCGSRYFLDRSVYSHLPIV